MCSFTAIMNNELRLDLRKRRCRGKGEEPALATIHHGHKPGKLLELLPITYSCITAPRHTCVRETDDVLVVTRRNRKRKKRREMTRRSKGSTAVGVVGTVYKGEARETVETFIPIFVCYDKHMPCQILHKVLLSTTRVQPLKPQFI